MSAHPAPEWVFDRLPPSGARRGGDPAEHAFKHDLDTFVREVVQNANDQRIGDKAPEVYFQFNELEGKALAAFLEKLAWPTLEPHLRAAGATRGGRAVGQVLGELNRSHKLLLLTVEDRHTVGLLGDEEEEDSHFRALCKDTLYSHKQSQIAAGGSYGLGKSVLWSFSGLSTVLFNSVLKSDPKGRKSPRLIGRTELPSHRVEEQGYGGSGWFGRSVKVDRGVRAESIWSLVASLDARELFLKREQSATGTSILIVGFRDPTVDEDETTASLSERMRKASARWFWPAMEMNTPGLRISADQCSASPDSIPALLPFVECWRGRSSRRETLDHPGDVVTRKLSIDLPPRRDHSRSTRAEVLLAVRLASEGARLDGGGHVAMFRGPGMVVKYWDRSSVAQGMRPFHAILACGEAREPGEVTEADKELERFLRDAEPPGHDDWDSTPALKENWKRGYKKALELLKAQVTQALRELLTPKPSHGSRGPERLQKRFPIGRRGPSEPTDSAFRFSDLRAVFDGTRWDFTAAVRPVQRTNEGWIATVSLREIGDSGVRLELIPIAELAVETEGARSIIEQDQVRIVAGTGVKEVCFRGSSLPVSRYGPAAELVLEVAGRLGLEA